MKKAKKLLMVFTVCVFIISTFMFSTSAVNAKCNSTTASQKYAAAMEPGWNLGNSFDSFDTGGDRGEESWGNPVCNKETDPHN